jgi:sialidase-1
MPCRPRKMRAAMKLICSLLLSACLAALAAEPEFSDVFTAGKDGYLNSRQFAGAKVRKTSVSRDGGATWSPVQDLPDLRDPSCNAGLLRYSFDDGSGKGRLLFSGPDSTKRDNGTIFLSLDDGATWPTKGVLWPGSFAYSALVRLPDGQVGCLFETDNYGRVVFARFPIAWLTEKPEAR